VKMSVTPVLLTRCGHVALMVVDCVEDSYTAR
jgi:hypothetical protein